MTLINKKVLVTGEADFTFSNLYGKFVAQNNEIIWLDNLITNKKENTSHLLEKR